MPVLFWFRRDLRLSDNTALDAAIKSGDQVIPVYVLSGWRENHRWTGAPRQEVLCSALASLAKDLERIGGRLIIRQGQADKELAKLARETGASDVYFNRDPDPFGRAMEKHVAAAGLKTHTFKDVVIHEEQEVLTGSGDRFRVFTPYSKAWSKLPKPKLLPKAANFQTPAGIQSLPLPTLETWGLSLSAEIPEIGEKAAHTRLQRFLDGPLIKYGGLRDFAALDPTSRLSVDLRFGTISIREIYWRCMEVYEKAGLEERKSIQTYINELIWREFYMAILGTWPEVLEHEFNPKFRGMKWDGTQEAFERWCQGETGFPIVDAGMRQLNATGFMHNRLRMITAMFLTKDLHIDWRLGEQYFMQQLVDGEIASNNGGWQWSAGTGADAAPYFRIQNPWSQTRRYDSEAAYIKRWLPELRDVPAGKLMEPPLGLRLAKNYPLPMVDHSVEREVALAAYSQNR